jgi:hypothetical protein
VKVHLGPRVGFGGLMTNKIPYVESFIVYDIQKGNTNDEIKFYMGNNKQKGKSHEDSLELRIYILFEY